MLARAALAAQVHPAQEPSRHGGRVQQRLVEDELLAVLALALALAGDVVRPDVASDPEEVAARFLERLLDFSDALNKELVLKDTSDESNEEG